MSQVSRIADKAPDTKKGESSSSKKTEFSRSAGSPAEQILFLQRTLGNRAVRGLISSGTLQAKLRVSHPGDKYEQEADRVAEQVMRMPQASESGIASGRRQSGIIQQKHPGCTGKPGSQHLKEDEEIKLQAKEVTGHTPGIKPETEAHINEVRSGGQPLSESVRAFYEPRFGHDFSQVRVHADVKAALAARAVNARAFTVGRDVVFGEGEYAPMTKKGNKLIAHELTHVVQQERGGRLPELGQDAARGRSAEAASAAISAGRNSVNVQGGAGIGLMRHGGNEDYVKPTPEILGIVNQMEAELAQMRASAEPAKSKQVEASRTFCVVKVVDQNGAVKMAATGAYMGKGPHAEQDALSKLDLSKISDTDTTLLMVDQVPCENKCTLEINKIKGKIKGEFRAFTKVKVEPGTRKGGSPKTAALSPNKTGQELMELTEFQKLRPTSPAPAGPASKHAPAKVPAAPPKPAAGTPKVGGSAPVTSKGATTKAMPQPPAPKAAPAARGGSRSGTGAAAGAAVAEAIAAIGAIVIQAKWIDPMNQEALEKDLRAFQPTIDASISGKRSEVIALQKGGRTAYANITVLVSHQADPQSGLVFYAGVSQPEVAISDQNISKQEFPKESFFRWLLKQNLGRSEMLVTYSVELSQVEEVKAAQAPPADANIAKRITEIDRRIQELEDQAQTFAISDEGIRANNEERNKLVNIRARLSKGEDVPLP